MALVAWRTGTWRLQIVKRSDAAGFEVLPKRWIVERKRWSHFLTQPAKVDSPMQRMTHHADAETFFG
jgi:transposase